MNKIKQSILAIVIGLALAAGVSFAAPQSDPPQGNAPAPINVGLLSQTFGNSGLSGQNKELRMGNNSGVLTLRGALNLVGKLTIADTTQGAGKVLTSDNNGVASWQDSASAPHGKKRFTSGSSGTFTVPTGVTKVWVSMAGGGGSGGGGGMTNGGGGGGGGSVIAQEVTVAPDQKIPVTVGNGGLSVSPKFDGIDGAPSIFGSITANGGHGGWAGTNENGSFRGNGGPGGTVIGANGVTGGYGGSRGGLNPGGGGGSIFGSGGEGGDKRGTVGGSFPGTLGSGYGGGGGGGAGDADINLRSAGGAGSPGFVLVEW